MQIGPLHIKKKHIERGVVFTVLGVLAAGGTWLVFIGPAPTVPQEFTQARLEGSLVAKEIVGLISQSNSRLNQISDYDRLKDYVAALEVSIQALDEGKEVPDKAVELSKRLELMTINLSEVYPEKARTKAQSAILTEVQLIHKLISYSNLQRQLLEELRLKLRAHLNGVESPGVEIQGRIEDINREIRNINVLNQEFNDLMKEFDTYFVK